MFNFDDNESGHWKLLSLNFLLGTDKWTLNFRKLIFFSLHLEIWAEIISKVEFLKTGIVMVYCASVNTDLTVEVVKKGVWSQFFNKSESPHPY